MNRNIPIMQVHLDFHTSPDIEDIGSCFSKENFQAALKAGNVDSITVFAKCHHGMCYYPTKVGVMHPHLDQDLTGAMIDAAHEIGVRAPVYITAGFSHYDAQTHPEWVMVKKDAMKRDMSAENVKMTDPKPHFHWQVLCLCDGNEYTKHIYELTEEVCRRYKQLDGLFYDICTSGEACFCESCKKGMISMGLDPDKDDDAREYMIMKRQAFMKKCGDILHRYHPEATVFFNGSANLYQTYYHDYQTHFELENLPTSWGTYNLLPMSAKFFSGKGNGVIGMTGKFHRDWGEFGSFKSKEALKCEVATMALYGVGASVGDHLHPDGEMEMQTYENIGYAYRYLEQIAPFSYGGRSTANIGVYPSIEQAANEGVSNILSENQLDYDVVCDHDFGKYDTVIIPGKTHADKETVTALKEYVAKGGKLVLVGDALVKDGAFLLDFGVKYLGKSEHDCAYLIPMTETEQLPKGPLLCNFPGHRVETDDAQVYAEWIPPYFNRTYAHFCGHQKTPYNKASKRYPAVIRSGNVVYISHALPAEYYTDGSLFHKRYFMMALQLIYGGSKINAEGLGTQGRCTMIHQPQQSRYCINMVYASPVKRGKAVVIEDIVTLYDIHVTLKLSECVKKVYLGLTGEQLEFTSDQGRIEFNVPQLHCHTAIVVEY